MTALPQIDNCNNGSLFRKGIKMRNFYPKININVLQDSMP